MRIRALAFVLLASIALLPTAMGDTGGNPCVRTYAAGFASGTYVFTTPIGSVGAVGVGVATNVVGSGVAVYVVVQPSNCVNTGPGTPGDGTQEGADPGGDATLPRFVLP